jgi:hypothetical protein
MEWSRQIDSYCERTDFSYWAEPMNAVSNAAFIIVALIMWRRSVGLPLARGLCVILFAIGVGSYLFHTHATVWGAVADVVPIGLFVLLYILVANLHFWSLPLWAAVLGALGFVPYAILLTPLFAALPFLAVSAFYWPVPLLIALYGVMLHSRHPATARGLMVGAGILAVSLVMRSLDQVLCDVVPVGTHFMWHVLNAIMLGWMIEVYRRHISGGPAGAAGP